MLKVKHIISSAALVLLALLLTVSAAYAQDGALQASYDKADGAVKLTASGLAPDTTYYLVSVKSADSVVGLGSASTDASGAATVSIPVGTLANGTYKAYVFKNEDGTVAASAQFAVKESNGGNSGGGSGGSSSGGSSSGSNNSGNTAPAAGDFKDVAKGSYYYEPVNWAVNKKITTGASADTFVPNEPCTRAQMVTFLWRAAGSPEAATSTTFGDVPQYEYYAQAVSWAASVGVTTGTGNWSFSPSAPCTRGQMATFLYRYSKSPQVSGDMPFADVADSSYYSDAVLWAYKNGVTTGITANMYHPDDTCTRGQMVTFLYRMMNK